CTPQSIGQKDGYQGTMTLDVMQVGDDGSILVNVTEKTDASNDKKGATAQIVVHPDGGLVIAGGTYYNEMLTLVPYLATKYFGDRELQEGAKWQVDSNVNKVQTSMS